MSTLAVQIRAIIRQSDAPDNQRFRTLLKIWEGRGQGLKVNGQSAEHGHWDQGGKRIRGHLQW